MVNRELEGFCLVDWGSLWHLGDTRALISTMTYFIRKGFFVALSRFAIQRSWWNFYLYIVYLFIVCLS